VFGRALRAGKPAAAATDHDEIPAFSHFRPTRVPAAPMIYSIAS
jgi:hypothetical protein